MPNITPKIGIIGKRENEINAYSSYGADKKILDVNDWFPQAPSLVVSMGFQAKNSLKHKNKKQIEVKKNTDRIEGLLFKLNQKVEGIESKVQIIQNLILTEKLVLPSIKERNQAFYAREKWISKQKAKYPNEIIAFIKENETWKIIAHSSIEENLLKKIDDLIEEKEINPVDHIIFRKL